MADRTKLKEIFDAAVGLGDVERASLIASRCNGDGEMRSELERLLAADDAAGGFLESSPFDESLGSLAEIRTRNFIGQKIGAYQIEREIGVGGMGTVFLATREIGELRQKVALKIVHQGAHSKEIVRRFLIERKILAGLEHASIARLIDAGETADGLPFLVMEYIDGKPLDEYCRAEDLSIENCLHLFRKVCSAVAYAHRRLVIHRDLKPSNILVTPDGEPKLLDFGIAKLLTPADADTPQTATLMNLLTPAYAAPEQIRGELVTTATDVYSLGIILYELLAGVRPFSFGNKNYQEIVRVICETEPPKPSEAQTLENKPLTDHNKNVSTEKQLTGRFKTGNLKSLRGDLDNIILKALRKDPERRYQAIEQFSDDIDRYLRGLPVSARPDTFTYRASKFFERNRIAVISFAIILLALVGGILGTTWQAIRAARQQKIAEQRFSEVRELANNVVFKYHDEIAKFSGSTALREQLVQDAVRYLNNLNADENDDNLLKLETARAYQKIGDVQGRPYTANLGKSDDALISYQKSIDILEKASANSPTEVDLKRELVISLTRLASLNIRLRNAENASKQADKALTLQTEINAAEADSAENRLALADVYSVKADTMVQPLAEKIEIYQKAGELLKNLPNITPDIQRLVTRINQRIGTNFIWMGDEFVEKNDQPNALDSYRKALQYNEKMFESVKSEIVIGGTSQNLERNRASSYGNLGENYFKLGEREKGLAMLFKNLEISLALAQADDKNTEANIDVSNVYVSFADAYEKFGDYEKAIQANQNALHLLEKVYASDTKNGEISNGMVLRTKQIVRLFEKVKRMNEAKVYRTKLAEMCKLDINTVYCK